MDWLSAEEWTAVRLSIRVAFWATLASLPFGVATAFLLARSRFWGRQILNLLVHLPLVIPPVATGYLLLILFGRQGAFGGFLAEELGIVFAFRWTGARARRGDHGLPADGAGDLARHGGGGLEAGGSRRDARRQPGLDPSPW